MLRPPAYIVVRRGFEHIYVLCSKLRPVWLSKYEGWNFNSGNYLFTTDTK